MNLRGHLITSSYCAPNPIFSCKFNSHQQSHRSLATAVGCMILKHKNFFETLLPTHNRQTAISIPFTCAWRRGAWKPHNVNEACWSRSVWAQGHPPPLFLQSAKEKKKNINHNTIQERPFISQYYFPGLVVFWAAYSKYTIIKKQCCTQPLLIRQISVWRSSQLCNMTDKGVFISTF